MDGAREILTDGERQRSECDALLLPYLLAVDEEQSRLLVAYLIADHATPIIKGATRSKMGFRPGNSGVSGYRGEELEDICSEVVVELLARLRNLKSNPCASAITDFHGFVRLLSSRACSRRFRRIDPNRHSLAGKLRYHLAVNPEWALWLDRRNEWICGLGRWRDEERPPWKPGPNQTSDAFTAFRDSLRPEDESRIKGVPALTSALFEWAGAPLELEDVIDTAVKLLPAEGPSATAGGIGRPDGEPGENTPDPRADVAREVEGRLYLERVWSEVKNLPLRQRRALLLNLRDPLGQGAAALLPVTGVASVREIAGVLEMPAEQIYGIWNDLPLDDTTIANWFGLSRQQVINLRRAARERLQRRMKALGAGD